MLLLLLMLMLICRTMSVSALYYCAGSHLTVVKHFLQSIYSYSYQILLGVVVNMDAWATSCSPIDRRILVCHAYANQRFGGPPSLPRHGVVRYYRCCQMIMTPLHIPTHTHTHPFLFRELRLFRIHHHRTRISYLQ